MIIEHKIQTNCKDLSVNSAKYLDTRTIEKRNTRKSNTELPFTIILKDHKYLRIQPVKNVQSLILGICAFSLEKFYKV